MTTTETRTLRYREAINEALHQEMERDSTIIVMGEEMAGAAGKEDQGFIDAWGGAFKTTVGLIQKFGKERVLDTPISEAGFVGAAIGAALTGLRPVAELMFSDFVGVCWDQLINNAAKIHYMYGGQIKVPFTLLTRIGAGVGSAAQHSESFYSMFAHMPGLKVVLPSDPYRAKGLLVSALRDDDPVIYCEHKTLYQMAGPVPEEAYAIPIGKGRVTREGNDITLVGISRMSLLCLEAAEALSGEGIDAEVIDLLSVSPLDFDLVIESVRKTNRLVIVDEDTPRANVASDIAATVTEEAFDDLDAPPKRVTAPHTPVPYGRGLESLYVPTPERIQAAVKSLL
jgi:pyruvate dehydrogenase E1 component beta subunit